VTEATSKQVYSVSQLNRLARQLLEQDLPSLPRRIGVITSPTGPAIRDVLHILRRRFPAIPVVVYPVQVQGEQAKFDIVRA
jgi:exodeoxyribonuclease VII large subunit